MRSLTIKTIVTHDSYDWTWQVMLQINKFAAIRYLHSETQMPVELVTTIPFKDSSHSLNLTGLCESLESVLPNHHGNSVLAHCLLTTNVVGRSVDSLVTDASYKSAAVFLAQVCELVLWRDDCVCGIEARELRWRVFPAVCFCCYVYGSAWYYLDPG